MSEIEQSIKGKIEAVGIPLRDWDIQINYGIKTGYNDAFVITTDKRDEILANCQNDEERARTSEIIRPILRGRDIKRYSYDWADLWLIYIPWHFPLHEDDSIQGASEKAEEAFKTQYPTIWICQLVIKLRRVFVMNGTLCNVGVQIIRTISISRKSSILI